MIVNGLGAVATGITLLVVLVTKFTSGAWVSALLIVALVTFMVRVRVHYDLVAKEIRVSTPLKITHLDKPIVIVPIQGWTKVSQRALQFGLTLSTDVRAVHVASEEETYDLEKQWAELVEMPVKKAGGKPPVLVNLPSPYRLILTPILDYVLEIEKKNPDQEIAIVVPELIEHHWYHYPLHNQRAELLKAMLLRKCSKHIVLINVPWQIRA